MKRMVALLIGASLFLASCTNASNSLKPEETERPSPTTFVTTAPSATPEPIASVKPDGTEPDSIRKVATDNGFRLIPEEHERPRELIATTVENGSSYTVHVLTTEDSGNNEGMYGLKAVVVHPESGAFRSYPLFRAKAGNSDAIYSLAKAYGFVDDHTLLYIAAHNDAEAPNGHYFSVEKLDILTGDKTVLIPRIQEFDGIAPPERFAKGWLTESKDKLMLNSYIEGKLWSIDTESGEMQLLPTRANHHWPFIMTSVSPDGERIWHFDSENERFVLLDNIGTIRNTFPFPSDIYRQQAGWFFWSPNGTYAVHYPNSNSSSNPIVHDNSEFVTRAVERLSFYDREGNGRNIQVDKSSSPYVEVAGWLGENDEFAVLRFYDVERTTGVGTPINESYVLYEPSTGNIIALKKAANDNEQGELEPVFSYQNRPGVHPPVLLVDRNAKTIVNLNKHGSWVSDDTQTNGTMKAWIRTNETNGSSILVWTTDGSFGELREQPLQGGRDEAVFAGQSWVAMMDMTYYRLD